MSLISGKQAFLAGLDWKNMPPGYRNARRFAQSQGAELYLSCHNHDGENGDEMMIALLSRQMQISPVTFASACHWRC